MRTIVKLTYYGKPLLSILIILFIILSFAILNTSFYISETYIETANQIKDQEKLLNYHVSFEGNFEELYADRHSMINLQGLYDRLKGLYREDYYEISDQFIYAYNYNGSAIFKYGYEEGYDQDKQIKVGNDVITASELKCMQLSYNCIDNFGIQIEQGRAFTEDDYTYSGKGKIPIILGSEYRDIYNVGDSIYGEYLFSKMEFVVAGIMKENSYVNNGWGLKALNRYILMPMFQCSYDSSTFEEQVFQIRHYINKLSGFLKIPSSYSYGEVKRNIETLAQNSNVIGFTVWDTDPVDSVQVGFMTINGKVHAYFIMAAALFTLIVLVIVSTILLLKRVKANIQDYTACLISGMDYRTIYRWLFVDSAFIIILGNIAAVLSSIIMFKSVYYSIYAMALSVVVVLIAMATFAIGINKKKVLKLMMEENNNAM